MYTWKGAQSYKKWLEETVMGHGSIGLLQALFLFREWFGFRATLGATLATTLAATLAATSYLEVEKRVPPFTSRRLTSPDRFS